MSTWTAFDKYLILNVECVVGIDEVDCPGLGDSLASDPLSAPDSYLELCNHNHNQAVSILSFIERIRTRALVNSIVIFYVFN